MWKKKLPLSAQDWLQASGAIHAKRALAPVVIEVNNSLVSPRSHTTYGGDVTYVNKVNELRLQHGHATLNNEIAVRLCD